MRGWRAVGVAAAGAAVVLAVLAAVLAFLAPDLSYRIRDRAAELLSGNSGRKIRIALGARTGSSYRVGTVLNQYLRAKAGYELELVVTASPGNVGSLLNANERIDLATINSADEEAARAEGVYGVAALDSQYFFVIVPSDSSAQEFRDLAGPVNPGVRDAGDPPTLGERVLEYYGLLAPPVAPAGAAARVTVVRPKQNVQRDFESGHMIAATRTQLLGTGMIDDIMRQGRYRFVPIRDHDALARSLPGTRAAFIPSGLYGPERRIPAQPVPTVIVTQLLVARGDVPGRVIRDILEVIYDPRFGRDLQFELTEASGRNVGGLPLHKAAAIYYHRNDLPTSDLLGRLSFVATVIAGIVATTQFVSRFRRGERVARGRRLLGAELAKLQAIRHRIEETRDAGTIRGLICEADDLLCRAERDAAADLLDAAGIQSVRSLHQVCWRAVQDRIDHDRPAPLPAATPAETTPAAESRSGGEAARDTSAPPPSAPPRPHTPAPATRDN
jgi:TRAP-type uncharacterized transport system substrate-binding protein